MSSRVPPFCFPPEPPRGTLCPSNSPSGRGGLADAQSALLLLDGTMLRVHLPGAASGEGPQPMQEPWGWHLLGTLNGKVLGLTPPLHPWHFLCGLPPLPCSQWLGRWQSPRAGMQHSSTAHTSAPHPGPGRHCCNVQPRLSASAKQPGADCACEHRLSLNLALWQAWTQAQLVWLCFLICTELGVCLPTNAVKLEPYIYCGRVIIFPDQQSCLCWQRSLLHCQSCAPPGVARWTRYVRLCFGKCR